MSTYAKWTKKYIFIYWGAFESLNLGPCKTPNVNHSYRKTTLYSIHCTSNIKKLIIIIIMIRLTNGKITLLIWYNWGPLYVCECVSVCVCVCGCVCASMYVYVDILLVFTLFTGDWKIGTDDFSIPEIQYENRCLIMQTGCDWLQLL